MSHPEDQLLVGGQQVAVGDERGSTISAASEPSQPRLRDRLPDLPPSGQPPLGREAELADLALMIAPGEPVQIYGPDGVGKTTLLHQLAHDLAAAGEQVIYLDGA